MITRISPTRSCARRLRLLLEGKPGRASRYSCGCAILLVAAGPYECAAQGGSSLIRETEYALANAVVAGTAAGILREIRGGRFVDGFIPGAAGGAVHYLGKRLLPAAAPWSDVVGHQLSSVGSSLVAHGAAAHSSSLTMVFPIGPLYITASRSEGLGYSLDVRDAVTILYGVLHPDLTFTPRESLIRTTPIFIASNGYLHSRGLTGAANGGVVFIEPREGDVHTDGLLVHEIVHVLQYRLLNEVLFHPAETAILARLPGGRRIKQLPIRLSVLYFAFNRSLGALSLKDAVLLPLEREATFLEAQVRIDSFDPRIR